MSCKSSGRERTKVQRWMRQIEGEVCPKWNNKLRPDLLGSEKGCYKLTDLIIKSGEWAQLLLSAQKPSSSNRHCVCARHDNFLWLSSRLVLASTCFCSSCRTTAPQIDPSWDLGSNQGPVWLWVRDLPDFCSHLSTSRAENLEMSFLIPVPQFPSLKIGGITSISLIVWVT